MIIAVNDMPEFGDVDEAAIGRIIIIDFDRQFREAEIDKDLPTNMSTPEELSGLLNLALKGLKQILTDNGLNEPDLEDKVDEYKARTSKLKEFIEKMCMFGPKLEMPREQFYNIYIRYCVTSNTRPLGECEFGRVAHS